MNMKKIISLLIGFLLAVAALIGCSGESTRQDPAPNRNPPGSPLSATLS